MSIVTFSMQLRDREVEVTAWMEPPDESVGIFGYGLDSCTVTDEETGVALAEPTPAELDEIEKMAQAVCHDREAEYV